MATKSISKSVVIREKRRLRKLLFALEKSKATDKKAPVSKAVAYEPTTEELRNIFKGHLVPNEP